MSPYDPYPIKQPPLSGPAVASLVVGILAILFGILSGVSGGVGLCCCIGIPFVTGPMAFLVGLAAVTIGYFGMQECQLGAKSGYALALAGMITGGVGALIGLVVFLIFAALLAFAAGSAAQQQNF